MEAVQLLVSGAFALLARVVGIRNSEQLCLRFPQPAVRDDRRLSVEGGARFW